VKSKALREKRAKLIADSRQILDKAEQEKRGLTPEEDQQYDNMIKEIDGLAKDIERVEKQERLEADLRQAMPVTAGQQSVRGQQGDHSSGPETRTIQMRGRTLNQDGLRTAEAAQVYIDPAFRAWMAEVRQDHPRSGLYHLRAMQADAAVEGGYLTMPEQFVAELIKFVDDQVFIRGFATVHQVSMAQSLGAPALDTDISDADWTSELATGAEDTALKIGKRDLHPHPLAKRIKVSNKLLRLTGGGAETLVLDRLGYKFAVTEEKGFLTGSGAQQPLGVFTASALGISTARDVSADNTTTEIRFDGLMNTKYALKGQYWPRGRWIFHRDALKQISKLKDGEGRYIWEQSVQVGQPDRILGFPVHMSEFTPNTFTTGLYVGILGDFSHYWIADALTMQLQRLVELYAETNQVGFIGRMEVDGMPVLEEAFVRVKLA
jgi:HK97 family phage major capsid protein